MIRREATEDWNDKKVRLKLKFGNLADSDSKFKKNKDDKLLLRLQLKLAITRDELLNIIASL